MAALKVGLGSWNPNFAASIDILKTKDLGELLRI